MSGRDDAGLWDGVPDAVKAKLAALVADWTPEQVAFLHDVADFVARRRAGQAAIAAAAVEVAPDHRAKLERGEQLTAGDFFGN